MKIKSGSLKKHIGQYMTPLPNNFSIQGGPLQIYDLQAVSEFLKTPTPLLKPNYNFIIHLNEGSIGGQVGPHDMEIVANSILFIMEGHIICRQKVSDNISGFCTIIKSQALNDLLSDMHLLRLFDIEPILNLSDDANTWITDINSLLHKELSGPNPNRKIASSLFQAVLHKLLSLADINDTNHPITREKKIAFNFKKLAYQYFIEQKEVSLYAKQLTVSESYLSRCVKQVFEKTPKRMLTEISILRGQLLLQDFSKRISEVAYELNYNDPSYFGRLFKQETNQTPSEYRDSIMQDLSVS